MVGGEVRVCVVCGAVGICELGIALDCTMDPMTMSPSPTYVANGLPDGR